MRKKRAWSTQEEDDQSAETAAFEETVAAARETAAKSSEFLSAAKSDLTDHHRWLKAQGVAVDRDRARHERWLERQREKRVAVARKDRTRLRRQVMRQRASEATQQVAGASVSYAGSMFVRVFAATGAGIKYVVLGIAGGFAFVGRSLRDGTLYIGRLIAAGAGWIAAKLKTFVFGIGRMLAVAFRWGGGKAAASGRAGGEALSSGSAFVSSKTVSSARAGGSVLAKGATFVSTKVQSSAQVAGKAFAVTSAFVAVKTGSAARATGSAVSAGSSFVSTKAQSSARVSGSALATGSSLVTSKADVFSKSAGRSFGTGLSAASAKSATLAAATSKAASHGFSVVGEKASVIAGATKRGLSSGFAWSKAQGLKVAPTVYERVAKVGQHAQGYARAGTALAKDGFEKAKALAPAHGKASAAVIEVYGAHADGAMIEGLPANDPWTNAAAPLALEEEVYGPFDEGFLVEGPSLNDPDAFVTEDVLEDVAPRVRREYALSSWAQKWSRNFRAHGTRARDAWAENALVQNVRARTRDVELSQMMIIAGAVLLVCGGLLLGGGFILRAGAVPGTGTRTVVPEEVVEEEIRGVAWTFEDYDSPLPDRAVFTLSGTPEAFGINGLSISGTNQSDLPLTGVHAILKPDVQRPDLKLILQVDKTAAADDSGPQALDIVPANTVPAHAPFRLVFPFPPEAMDGEDGVAVEDFFDSYGGLLLKFQYEIDGTQKSLIQYLPPELLRSQLEEVAGEASGS